MCEIDHFSLPDTDGWILQQSWREGSYFAAAENLPGIQTPCLFTEMLALWGGNACLFINKCSHQS